MVRTLIYEQRSKVNKRWKNDNLFEGVERIVRENYEGKVKIHKVSVLLNRVLFLSPNVFKKEVENIVLDLVKIKKRGVVLDSLIFNKNPGTLPDGTLVKNFKKEVKIRVIEEGKVKMCN